MINLKEELIMLVISRTVGEKFLIPGLEMEIVIIAIQGAKARIGFSAPASVIVRRQEISVAPKRNCRTEESST